MCSCSLRGRNKQSKRVSSTAVITSDCRVSNFVSPTLPVCTKLGVAGSKLVVLNRSTNKVGYSSETWPVHLKFRKTNCKSCYKHLIQKNGFMLSRVAMFLG